MQADVMAGRETEYAGNRSGQIGDAAAHVLEFIQYRLRPRA